MTGLTSLAHHLITIWLIWLAVIIITQIIKWAVLKGLKKTGTNAKGQKPMAKKIVSVVRIVATTGALIATIIFVLFMYNPLERTYDEMNKIKPATTNEQFVEPTEEEIEKSNEDAVNKESEKKKEEAKKDNDEAMDKADEIFGN